MKRNNLSTTTPLVYLVVLNWNGYEDTRECLQSLAKIHYDNYRILVVDNGSSDDSPDRIEDEYNDVHLIRCQQNRGIAAGYNKGIQVALARGADHIVVMNNDLIFDPDFLKHMVVIAGNWPKCGVVMPKIFYYDEPDVIWSTGGRTRWMPSNILLRGRKQKDGPKWQMTQPIEFAPSCCLLLTREVCETVTFDEHYFFYYDDWGFCVQVREHGWRIIYAADSLLWHKVSRSTQNSPKTLRWWRILGQSCARYHRIHHNKRLLAAYVAWVLLRETAKGNVKSMPMFLKGIYAGLQAETIDDIQPEWNI
ncbi:MAG: glycosyltransferase family 2 protein [Anaerolineae bacterium]